ncbi:MAG: hypothetical protein JST38_10225 [Bacteroidetes bacterium]|nr:hypothetical protein [Bacteroidota bacterium]MBS1941240.1 hypothetical protein [Bacteroidota bacterium]
MKAYLLLFFISAILLLGTVAIYRKTRQGSFLLGMCILYFWTFLGAWFFIGDALSGYQGYKIGLAYYYLMEKMFPFELDHCYTVALWGYGLFTVALLAGVFLMIPRKGARQSASAPLPLDHRVFLVVAVVAAVASFLIVRPLMMQAIQDGESVYLVTRTTFFEGSTIHALCNELAAFSLLLGWSLYLTGDGPRHFARTGGAWIGYAYPVALVLLELYLMLLGNKHELFMGLVLGLLLFFGNAQRPAYGRLAIYVGFVAVPLFLTGQVRGRSLHELPKDPEEKAKVPPPFTVPILAHVPRAPKASGPGMRLGQMFFSNEMFAAHFSLYGICRNHVRPVPGISARYLASSLVPRLMQEERPPTAYDAYADQCGLMEGQGYTIHQAAAWYMNGGWPLVGVGGLFFGLIWGLLMRWNGRSSGKWLPLRILSVMGTSCWTAYLPMLVRDGPETLKALLLEGFALPIGVVLLAAIFAMRHPGREPVGHGT